MASSITPPQVTKRQIAAVLVGNGLDFYDFMTYTFFATQIGKALFPADGGHQLLLSLATFGTGFLMRPVGSVVLGRLADRRGRRPAMLMSFTLMGLALVVLALIPSYAVIGIAAPILAITCRMIQGFALGGEVGPNTAYLLEIAPPHRRGLYTSLAYGTQNFAILLAGIVGFGLSSVMDAQALVDWGWRIAFLAGASIVPFALIVRRSLVESLPTTEVAAAGPAPTRWLALLILGGGLVLAAGTILGYTANYLNSFAQDSLGLSATVAFAATMVQGGAGMLADPVVGWLSDRYGRKTVLYPANLAMVLMLIPSFMVMVHFHNAVALLTMTALFAVIVEAATGPSLTLLTELLPAHIRASGVGITYAVSICLFGGSAQVIEKLLIDVTGSPLAPAWYATGAIFVGLVGITLLRPQRGAVSATWQSSDRQPLPAP